MVSYALFMIALLAVVGSGMGIVEVTIWLVLLGVGVVWMVRRFRITRATEQQQPAGF